MDQAPQAPTDADAAWREAFEVPPDELDAPGMWSDPNFSLSKSASIGTKRRGEGHWLKRARRRRQRLALSRGLMPPKKKKKKSGTKKKSRLFVGMGMGLARANDVASEGMPLRLLPFRCVQQITKFKSAAWAEFGAGVCVGGAGWEFVGH